MRNLWQAFVQFFVSLKLTVALLVLSLLLVFFATLDQQNLGVWGIQQKWFHSIVVLQDMKGFPFPIFPGGYFLGGLLLINLISAHVYRFKLSLRKSGIFLTHVGLILLLIGELLSGILQEDFQMQLTEGETKSYAESQRLNELAVIDASDPKFDDVVAIPEKFLEQKASLQHPKLPFRVSIRAYYPNAAVQRRDQAPNAPPSLATSGAGPQIAVTPLPITYRADERNVPAAFVEFTASDNSTLGTWLVCTDLMPQTFSYEGKTWKFTLRPERRYNPYELSLLKVTNDIFPGTDIPKNFSSRVHIKSDDGKDDREVLIYMNNPLRFKGMTFYQYQMDAANRNSVLQVVRNPSWLLPYISCILMGLGLVIQFGIHLFGFIRKRTSTRAVAA